MSDERSPNDPTNAPGPYSEEIQHAQVSALVPERVARGVFSTGAVVVQGAHEFIIDFLLRMSQPHQVVARVVLPPGVAAQLIAALSENLRNYEAKHGPPVVPTAPGASVQSTAGGSPASPPAQVGSPAQFGSPVHPGAPVHSGSPVSSAPTEGQPVSAQELYEQLKLADDVVSGSYANAVMIGHTPTEFCFDFITTFFPRSSVSCRVFMSAPGIPRLLDSLRHAFEKFQQRMAQQFRNPPPPPAQQ